MRALITGATGFAGAHLVRFLLAKGYTVCGTSHQGDRLEGGDGGCRLEPVDITDRGTLYRLLTDFHPDEIYHLAALAVTTGRSAEEYYRANFTGSLNLLQAARAAAPGARVLHVGSAYAYGQVPAHRQPIMEDEQLSPLSHYAAGKAAADMAACAYAMEGLFVVRARPFNHTGPGQTTDYVCSRMARLIAEASLGLREPLIEAGNLDAVRDFTDVRDVVRAYWLLLQRGRCGDVYNVCGQKAFGVREIIARLVSLAGMEIAMESRRHLWRPLDIPQLVGSREKIFNVTGWEPLIDFSETLGDLLAWWRGVLQQREKPVPG